MRNKNWYVALAILALVLSISPATYGQAVRGEGLAEAGPVSKGPMQLFPAYFMDKNGRALEGCLEGPPNCLSSAAELANPAVGEAFYWSASADVRAPTGGGNGLVEFALEMAFLNPTPNRANAMVFNRLRVRLNNLPAPGPYTMDHPFGTGLALPTQPDDTIAGRLQVNMTTDIPGAAGPASFSAVLRAPNIGPFLRQTTAPPGYLGSPNIARTVVGGPVRNTIVIKRAGVAFMSTNRFAVEGKIATNGGLSGVRSTYSRDVTGAGTVNVSAHSVGFQQIVAKVAARPAVRMRPVAGQIGDYTAAVSFAAGAAVSPVVVRNRSDASVPKPSATVQTKDIVTITQATLVAGTLTVRANSSDRFTGVGRARLQVQDSTGTRLGVLNKNGVFRIDTPINPGTIRVVSNKGGVALARVQ